MSDLNIRACSLCRRPYFGIAKPSTSGACVECDDKMQDGYVGVVCRGCRSGKGEPIEWVHRDALGTEARSAFDSLSLTAGGYYPIIARDTCSVCEGAE